METRDQGSIAENDGEDELYQTVLEVGSEFPAVYEVYAPLEITTLNVQVFKDNIFEENEKHLRDIINRN